MSDDTVDLTVDEAAMLALRLIVERLHDDEWVISEDLPHLSDDSKIEVFNAVSSHLRELTDALTRQERLFGIDSALLLERAR